MATPSSSSFPDASLANLLTPEHVIPELRATDRAGVIAELVEKLDALNIIPREIRGSILAALLENEHQACTCIGSGVAIPHCYSAAVTETVFVFGRSISGVDFDAADGGLVHFFLLYLVPEDRHLLHLQTLRSVAQTFLSSKLRQELLAAPDAQSILALFRKYATD